MKYFLNAWKKFVTFEGRAQRAEYWYFVLFNIIFYITIIFLIGFIEKLITATFFNKTTFITIILANIYLMVSIIPMISVTVRRLHDIGKSGWWYFISFVPLIGGIWIFILTILDSEPGENKYGPNPKGVNKKPE